jgi:hypothetical protein
MIDLPKKDKNGKNCLSYSQISLFLKDKNEYYKSYILKEPFKGNAYTDFGSKVGNALETLDYSLFMKREIEVLNKVTRLDLFERPTFLKYDDFYIVGYIDTCNESLTEIIDYKTGGAGKEWLYTGDAYTQLCYYALSLRQETGKQPEKASIEFIRRTGNAFKGETLKVGNEDPIKIEVDISEKRLKKVYWETIDIAKEISEFYKQNKP